MLGRKDNKISVNIPLDIGAVRGTPLTNIHDFGCQLIDDSKNDGFAEGVVISISRNGSGRWIGRAVGNFDNYENARFALVELLKIAKDHIKVDDDE